MAEDQHDGMDYSNLLRSPYDPDPKKVEREEGSSELSWKPPVISAIAGALLVGVVVVIGASSDPVLVADEATASTSTVAPADAPAEQSTELPPGYDPLDEAVGARVETVEVSPQATAVAVTTAVAGGIQPADVPPFDVAYWELTLADGGRPMLRQYGQTGTLGNVTIEFAPLAAIRDASLTAYPAVGSAEYTEEFDLDATVPQEVTDIRIDIGDGNAVFVHSLSIGDGWGHISWTVEGDMPVRVDTTVTFVGTDDPGSDDIFETRLTPAHMRQIAQGTGTAPMPPLYGFSASQPLVRSGEPLSGTNAPTSISVSIVVTRPESIGEGAPIEVPPLP